MAYTAPTRKALGIESDRITLYPRGFRPDQKKLAESIQLDQNIRDRFRQALVVSNFDDADGTVYTGAASEVLALNSGVAVYEVFQAAVASAAVIAPFQSGDGLELQPVAAADALELTNGTSSLSRAAYTVGSLLDGKKLMMSVKMKIDDISDVTEIFCGWRKAEAYQADPDSYAAVAAFHIGATDDGRISITTSVSSTETVVDTTLTDWADAGEHTLRIEVDNLGLCKFLYDGAAPTVTVASFKFTAGEVIVPFLHMNTETGDPGCSISQWDVGYM